MKVGYTFCLLQRVVGGEMGLDRRGSSCYQHSLEQVRCPCKSKHPTSVTSLSGAFRMEGSSVLLG